MFLDIWMSHMSENFQAILYAFHTSAHSQRHSPFSLPLLRKEISSEIRYEKAYFHSHR